MAISELKIRKLPNVTVAQMVRAFARQADVLGSNPSECHILNFFRHVLSSMLSWRIVGRSNIVCGLHNLIMLIRKRNKNKSKVTLYIYIYIYMVDKAYCYEVKLLYIYIYIYIYGGQSILLC